MCNAGWGYKVRKSSFLKLFDFFSSYKWLPGLMLTIIFNIK